MKALGREVGKHGEAAAHEEQSNGLRDAKGGVDTHLGKVRRGVEKTEGDGAHIKTCTLVESTERTG